ncbi:hypothetical protein HC766_04635 [Candidatus Gracilibacteria bacterium]|nr:hypothetical protein [Candidatus Gracilibacteria bacterium]NJS41603.1 hypothetical protein [Candidatus Gracilibacteria bacterium]
MNSQQQFGFRVRVLSDGLANTSLNFVSQNGFGRAVDHQSIITVSQAIALPGNLFLIRTGGNN